MRLLLLVLSLLALTSTTATAAEPDDHAQLRHIKLELWPKAYREQDVELLDRILDDSFQMIDGRGQISTKADELAWIAKHPTSYDSFNYEIERLDVYAGQSAIVAGQGTIAGTRDGKAWTHVYRSSNVLIKRDGRWVAVASHVSSVAE